MATIKIFMKASETGKLILFDTEGHIGKENITTNAQDGDTIIWTLADDSGIKEITCIAAKQGSKNLFSEGPVEVSNAEWQGTISSLAKKGEQESYCIKYELNDGTRMMDDPIVVVDPPTPKSK